MSTPKDESEKKLAAENTSLEKEASAGGGGYEEADGAATGKLQRETAGGGGASGSRDVDLGLDGQQHSSEPIERQRAEEPSVEEQLQDPNDIDEGQHEEHEDDDNEEALLYPEPNSNSPLLPPAPADFKPFFTLIESSSSATDSSSDNYHHPSVHYVFADDDPEILTAAALESLDADHEQADNPSTAENERFVILDLSPSGKEVVSATSLSPDWQALRTSISPAPSWGGSSDGKGEAERGLMLRISGQEARTGKGGKAKRRDREDVEGLLRGFDELMTGLDGVLGDEREGGAEVDIDTRNTQTVRERVHEIDSI